MLKMLFAMLFGTLSLMPVWAAEPDPNARIWCYDKTRSLVTQRVRWRCKGEVVDEQTAARLKTERVRRIQRALQQEKNPVVPGKRLISTGSGFFISGDGQVLTNHHVVRHCERITVIPAGGDERVAELVAEEPRFDLALLSSGTPSSEPARLATSLADAMAADDPIHIIGYPLHGKVLIKPRLVSGLLHRPPGPSVGMVVIKADVRRGNSGGPILNSAGDVVGIVTAKVDTPEVYARTGELIRDVGIGIRAVVANAFLEQHGVKATVVGTEQGLTKKALIRRGEHFVAQIGCWAMHLP